MSDEIVLPPLHDATIGPDEVRALLGDVLQVAQLIGHSTKGGATTRASEATGALAIDGERLLAGEIAGLQLRYRHQGKEWWDTLVALTNGRFRLVRIEQRWDK